MRVVLVYNNASGGKYTLAKLRQLCRDNNITITYSFTVRQLGSPKLAQLVRRGVIIMAVGGDGTMNSVARLMIDSPSLLLPLPGGTLNHFVRDLGMKGSLEELLSHSDKTKETTVDVGYVNEELFLNNSSLGLYPFTLLDRKRSNPLVTKWAAALYAGLRQLIVFRRHSMIIDGAKIRSPFVFVGNNRYNITSSLIPQRTKLTAGVLTVIVASSASRWRLVRAGINVMRGTVSHLDDFTVQTRKSVVVYTHASQLPVSFDGEVKYVSSPFTYSSRPKSLRVLVIK